MYCCCLWGRSRRCPPLQKALHGGEEGTVRGDVAVGHAGGVEGETGIAVAVEQNKAAGGVRAFGEKMDSFARGEIGGGKSPRKAGRGGPPKGGAAQQRHAGGLGGRHP